MSLRPYQAQMKADIFQAWQTSRNVLAVSATGTGKTVVMGDVIKSAGVGAAVMAHRSELVTQISTALARERVPHRIIGPASLRRDCQAVQVARLGQHWIDPGARCGVAGIDTLVKREVSQDSWFREIRLWVTDEGHHLLKENKWGRGVEMFPNAHGLGFTATPLRADGKGLGADSDGLYQSMVEGPDMRHQIDAGYLTDYRIFAPPSDVVYADVPVTATGDLSLPQLRAAVHSSDQFVGDIVKHYLRIAPGKLGLTFAVDIESAGEIAAAYRAAGVPAEVISSKTDPLNRVRLMRAFERREILQLVNVDLLGEGTDVPAIEVVSMGRKTESLALFMQQFGRALRLMVSDDLQAAWGSFSDAERLAHIAASSKPKAIIIDHVQNTHRHGLPDSARVWSLDPRGRRSSGASDAIPVRTCVAEFPAASGLPCLFTYERFRKVCPNCGAAPVIADRSAPEYVDGDLYELSPETLAALRGRAAAVDRAPGIGAPPYIAHAHQAGVQARYALRDVAAIWAGWQTEQGFDQSESYRRFYHAFGIDVASAQALNKPQTEALTAKIQAVLDRHNVRVRA